MPHAMWHTVQDDALALGLAGFMIGIILCLPLRGLAGDAGPQSPGLSARGEGARRTRLSPMRGVGSRLRSSGEQRGSRERFVVDLNETIALSGWPASNSQSGLNLLSTLAQACVGYYGKRTNPL